MTDRLKEDVLMLTFRQSASTETTSTWLTHVWYKLESKGYAKVGGGGTRPTQGWLIC